MSSSTNDIDFNRAVGFINSDKPLKGNAFNNAQFSIVISIFCAVFLVAVCTFDYFISTDSETQNSINDASVSHTLPTNQNYATVAASLGSIERQNAYIEDNALVGKTALSENYFRQESQSIVFRDEERQPTNLQAHVIRMDTALSNEDFRVEAEQVLYRDENK